MGLPGVEIRGAGQQIHFAGVQGYFQGTGLRSLYPIVAALTDTRLRAILIDEPELSLEPTLQKALRDLLIDHATDGRSVIVATHSHLFLDRQTVEANLVLDRHEGAVTVRMLETQPELRDVVFRLLGNSTEESILPA